MPEHIHHFTPMPWFSMEPAIVQLFLLAVTIFWIWTMIDCIRNSQLSGASRVLWLFFILFTHWIGAVCYFIFGRSRNKIQYQYHSQQQRQGPAPYQHYIQPQRQQQTYYQPKQSRDPEYRAYEQGYHMQERPSEISQERESTPAPSWQQYEEPQASYPEMPQQQNN